MEKYQVVWEVLNALRSLDERFDSMINKLNLNNKRPDNFNFIGVGEAPGEYENSESENQRENYIQESLNLDGEEISELERAIYGKIVKKVGNVRYWEDWSKDVANIANQHKMRIEVMLEDKKSDTYSAFQEFLMGLRHNINDSISKEQAIEMLAQHLITRPVFEALFESYSFVNDNPISRAMNTVLKAMDEQGLLKEQEALKGFYESVRMRAAGIDNLKAKQDIIIKLYDSFFKHSAQETVERLGIVFTPIEVVDFIIHSVNDVLKKHFGKTISDEGVHVLDPFTGTGTFIVRLLQSGLISKEDLLRKYTKELHANEIVLLSYYIAAINIEETFHELIGGYKSFGGIVLTDTFDTTEIKNVNSSKLFDENNLRLKHQKESPIFAIIGNPPYSIGQDNVNNDNQNHSYPILDRIIEESYAKYSTATLRRSLYDSYIRAFKWSSERIKDKGVIGFVSNASFIDSQSTDGLRKCWHEDFNYIYVFNLRGNQRTEGEKSRQEGGKIFDSGSRAPIAITLLVKDGSNNHKIYYHDIGDYLSRDEKLKIISDFKSFTKINWKEIEPDKHNDWINQRESSYETFIPFIGETDDINVIFKDQYTGVVPARDMWVVGFSKQNVKVNSNRMVENYNNELLRLSKVTDPKERFDKVNKSDNFIKWSRGLTNKFKRGNEITLNENEIILFMHRPFTKKWMFYNRDIIEMPSRYRHIANNMGNVLYIQGQGSNKDFSALVTNLVPNFQLIANGKGFPMYIGEDSNGLPINNISNYIKNSLNFNNEEVFYYIYALLHSKEYCKKFSSDLQKAFPRIPILKNKMDFVRIGHQLVDLHLNYENFEPYSHVEIIFHKENPSYKVAKMKHPKVNRQDDKTTILFNNDITINNIPEKAYEYMVNGKTAIGWIMDQYKLKVDNASGIVDDPNLYSKDEKYIFNLLLRIINVSLQTIDLINSLPPLEILD